MSASVGPGSNPTTPEYRNWLALGHALTTVLCKGLCPFIKRETEAFYNRAKAEVSALSAGPCTCVHTPRRRPNEFHDMRTCAWAQTLQKHHRRHRPNWKQSNSTKWMDPNLGPWEIAMLFLPDLGGHAPIQGAEDMDISGLLNLMYWCDQFAVQQLLITEVRDTRNNKWVHVPKLELSDADKKDAFDAIEKLLQDPKLVADPDAQNALREIINLKTASNLQSMEAKYLNHFKDVIDKELLEVNNRLTGILEESARDEEEREQLMQRQHDLEEALDDLNKRVQQKDETFIELTLNSIGCLFSHTARHIRGLRNTTITSWLILVLLFISCTVLDDTSILDGCTMEKYGDPLQLKNFDFRDIINSSREGFIGRQWLYSEVESIFEQEDIRGVLITGNPGSGKSAFLSQLICTKTSSPFIHNRILGYHFCMHSDEGTQNGAKFVRNLANMIAWRFTEYREIIQSDSFIHRVLYNDCSQYSEWCLEQGILIPLSHLNQKLKESWYIVIDALDECSTDRAEILNMFKSKLRRFPTWLKLIITSRNISAIRGSFEGVNVVELRSDDNRNVEDIYNYLSLRIFSLRSSILQKIKTAFSITDNNSPTQEIVSRLAEKAEGNFLFVKVVLDSWLSVTTEVSWEMLPKSLDSIFEMYFERKYSPHETFHSLREILEILVASHTPISANQIHAMLRFDHPTLDFEYELIPKLHDVSLFLWHGSELGLVRIYHASLSDWLTSEANKGKFYYVKKQNGHKRLAEFYLQDAQRSQKALNPDEAFYLASHIVQGGSPKSQVEQYLSLPSDRINSSDPNTNSTALHLISSHTNPNVTKLLIEHFSNVDFLDESQRTPAFIAAARGNLESLVILFQNGANIRHVVGYPGDGQTSVSSMVECRRKCCEYSLVHISSQEGHVHIVDFLIKHQADIFRPTGTNNTAVQLAAVNGHLKIIERLQEAGATLDSVSLHHAAVGGHIHVVGYLLKEGVKDTCIYDRFSYLAQEKSKIYDNHFIRLGETALHAAVKKEHTSVIEMLLSQNESAVYCTNAAGRRPLHEAVYLNNFNALKVMLAAGVDASAHCNHESLSAKSSQLYFYRFTQTRCPCGFTPLHTAAMHGNHSIAKLLIKYVSDLNPRDCNGSAPLHIASCQGMLSLVNLLVDSGANITYRSFNGSTPLHSAAACFATEMFLPLLNLGCDFFATDIKGLTALHYTIKDLDVIGIEYFVDMYASKPKDWIEAAGKKKEILNELTVQYPWLHAMIGLVRCFASTESEKVKIHLGMDAFRIRPMIDTYASIFDVVAQRSNASLNLTGSNMFRMSRLVVTATPWIFIFDLTLCEVVEKFVLKLNRPYEPSFVPNSFSRAIAKSAALIFTAGLLNCPLLTDFISDNLVYMVDIALQAGADVNCRNNLGATPLHTYLHTGGRHMSKVLTKHKVKVDISCGDPFEISTLHLISYHKLHYLHYLHEFMVGDEHWQKYLESDHAIFDYFLDSFKEINVGGQIKTVRSGDGPLALAIKSHRRGVKVLDECYDDDGYNALHRAAQGANLIAIQKFLSWGAKASLENFDGLSPLIISIVYAIKYRPFLNLDQRNILSTLEVELASMSASAIMEHLLKNGLFDVGCDSTKSDLTVYHVAATRGMWQFIAHLFASSGVVGLDVNCPNKDGITPMYLAKFIGGEDCKWRSPWCKVVHVIRQHGGVLQYPTLEAEYFLIFNIYFGISPSRLNVELTDQEILTLQKDCGLDECRSYRVGPEADIYRKSEELDKVYSDYDRKVDDCTSCGESCLPEINNALCHLMSMLTTLKRQLDLKNRHFHLRNKFVTFLDEENDRVRKLFLAAIRPHEAMSCGRGNSGTQTIGIDNPDMCSGQRMDLEQGLREFYRQYKNSFDELAKSTEDVKSVLSCGGRLPHVMRKISKALYGYDTTQSCDWQSVATKYLRLSFQTRTLNFWRKAVLETSTIPSVSEFLSSRMEKVFMEPSKESVKLILRLASKRPSSELNYLAILRFMKPPLIERTLEETLLFV